MKKAKLIIISSLTLLSLVLPNDCYAAKETVNMSSGGVEDWPVGNPYPKSPVEVPTVSIDGYTLFLDGNHADYTLELVDANDTVVYSTFVPSTVSVVMLPSALSGNYELRLYPGGSYYFYGYISL